MSLGGLVVLGAVVLALAPPPVRAQVGTTFVPSIAGFTDYGTGTLPPAWGDYDDDGFVDLPLFHNEGDGSFREIPGFREILAGGNYHGAAWADYDRDGRLDLVILAYAIHETRSLLLHNEGDGTFRDVAPELGMDVLGYGETAAWGDYDGDSRPDLFAPYYSHLAPFRSFLYRNDGDGLFSEVAEAIGVHLPELPVGLRPEGAQWVDWDDDGDLDLYCASHLFANDGFGRFTDVRASVGLPESFDEGAMFVDFDNDGDLDFNLRTLDGPRLFMNDGGIFSDVTELAGLLPGGAIWGDSWADADNDGDLDLLTMVHDAPARLMLNQGNGTFVSDPVFEALDIRSDNSAWADFDNDGDLDVALGAITRVLLVNQLDLQPGSEHTSLRVRAVDAAGHRSMHGATVRVRRIDVPSTAIQTRVVDGGSGYLSQSEYTTHFGVVPTGQYAIEVSFPSAGGQRVIVDAAVDPALGSVVPETLEGGTVVVFRDGAVDFENPPPRPPPPPEELCELACPAGQGIDGCCTEALPVCGDGGCCPTSRPQHCGTHCCPATARCGSTEGVACLVVSDCPPHAVFPRSVECPICVGDFMPRAVARRFARAARLFEHGRLGRAERKLEGARRRLEKARRRFWVSADCATTVGGVLAEALELTVQAREARRALQGR